MIIRKLHIKGFRNFRDTVIRFEGKNLIIVNFQRFYN